MPGLHIPGKKSYQKTGITASTAIGRQHAQMILHCMPFGALFKIAPIKLPYSQSEGDCDVKAGVNDHDHRWISPG